eukprot:CAMPEP_0170452668 /NCGR_PEP_ID=MMETSP0123-20130129/1489_1 /TAXON_ID=182087 /ORGANISM="Favella ehrenbergii, Strain Fehren 1" /LENGTH=193 /DNA_ID=CAMNT_0010714749 /DNA_START=451 /DNA_END=1031 /DNA_ORIENTATION=+
MLRSSTGFMSKSSNRTNSMGASPEFRLSHQVLEPLVDVPTAESDPPSPEIWVLLFIIEGRFLRVITHGAKTEEGWDAVEGVSHDHHHFISCEKWRLGHNPRGVRFHDPNSVIDDMFTFKTLHLEAHIDMEGVIRASLDPSEQLEVLAHESVAGAWEGAKRDFLALILLTVQKSTIAIKHPFAALPQHFIFALK